jgi:outer membrane protein insertion porin family
MPNSQCSYPRIRSMLTAGSLGCLVRALCVLVLVSAVPLSAVAQDTISAPEPDPADDAEAAAGQVVVDVRIEGNETIPEAVILQKLQAQPHRSVSERMLREDKRSLLNTRWFFEVRERIDETPDGLVLVFEVRERPIVQRVEFRGNEKIKLKHLKAWTGLKAGSPFDYVANQEAVRRIEQEYRDKGYYFIEVTLVKGGKAGDREVIFQIKEGPKVQVKERNFEGNKFWSDGDLRKNLISKEAFLFWGGFYNPDTIPSDIEALKAYYRGVGYFDVEVTGQPRFSDDKSDVELLFTIKEGRRYTVREIRFEGNSLIPTNRLREDSKLKPGDKFNSYPLSKDVQRMLGYYGDMGHYFASVNPVPQFTEQEGIVDLLIEIDEDRPRFIRDINVHYDGDAPHTKQTVVLDRIQVQPGDLADPRRIRRGKTRLAGSGLFDPGLTFDVEPVDPEQTSFASLARTVRGQEPQAESDEWTQDFVQAVHTVADSSIRETEIGNYSALLGTHVASVRRDQSSADPEAAMDAVPPSDADLSAGTSSLPQSDVVSVTTSKAPVRDESERVPAEGRQSGKLATEKSSGAQSRPVPADRTLSLPPGLFSDQVPQSSDAESLTSPTTDQDNDWMSFRTVAPSRLFSLAEEAPAFVSGDSAGLTDQPLFRAQSPEGNSGEAGAPRREDSMINESPYRNQFRDIPPGWVDINVNAAEGRTGRLMFGAGINSNAGVVGNFVWDESNFDLFRPPTTFADILEGRAWRGGGQRFRAEAAPGNQVSRYALTWTDPYFLYSDYSLSVSGFYFNRYYPDWTEDRVGGRVSVGRQFTPEWSGAVALRLENVEMRNVRTPVPTFVDPWVGHNLLSTGRISLTHDTRDSAMLPSEGHYFDAGYEQAFNEFNYPKVDTEFRQYFTVHSRPDGSGRQVLTLAGALGWAGDDTPVFERYFAGGFQSFRGFRFRGVTPRDDTGFSTGGTFQALGTVEYRLPLTADDMIAMVVFSDFGSVDDEVSMQAFRATAGFGARVTIPAMGPVPLAFDFAFPIASEDFDREQIFSFYVGVNR